MAGNQSDLFGAEGGAGAQQRAREVRQPQQEQVLQVLLDAYPNTISHAEICARIGSNRASHRIKELIDEGWQIEGAAELPLDEDSQTQLYRLASPDLQPPIRKHVGFTVRWTEDAGLTVSRHRDCNGAVPTARLKLLATRIKALVQDELHDLLPPQSKPEGDGK